MMFTYTAQCAYPPGPPTWPQKDGSDPLRREAHHPRRARAFYTPSSRTRAGSAHTHDSRNGFDATKPTPSREGGPSGAPGDRSLGAKHWRAQGRRPADAAPPSARVLRLAGARGVRVEARPPLNREARAAGRGTPGGTRRARRKTSSRTRARRLRSAGCRRPRLGGEGFGADELIEPIWRHSVRTRGGARAGALGVPGCRSRRALGGARGANFRSLWWPDLVDDVGRICSTPSGH